MIETKVVNSNDVCDNPSNGTIRDKSTTTQEGMTLIDQKLEQKQEEELNVDIKNSDNTENNDGKEKESSNNEKQNDLGTNPPAVVVGMEALQDALQKMQSSNEATAIKSCAQMLYLYTSNLSTNPNSKQYRKIYTNSKTYTKKVGQVEFAKDVLLAVGFVDEEKSFLEWKNDTDIETAIGLLKEAASMLKKVKAGEQIDFTSAVFDKALST